LRESLPIVAQLDRARRGGARTVALDRPVTDPIRQRHPPRPEHLEASVHRSISAALLVVPVAAGVLLSAGPASADDGRDLFIRSAVEDVSADTATLPIAMGVADGETFWYVVTESSAKRDARSRGVNHAPKLANARGTDAVQSGRFVRGVLHVDAGVDFSPERVVVPGPGGFPPVEAAPGAVGDSGYSPLVQLPDGTVINAPHVANSTGLHDKLVGAPDVEARTATFRETEGFYDGKEIYYVSFDASAPDIAALEAVTYAPALNAAPGLGSADRATSARSGIAPFVNGRTGLNDPDRQGLASALLGEGDPLNVTQSSPHNSKYSPLWDVYATMWSADAKAAGHDVLQDDFDDIEDLAEGGVVTGPGGAPWGAIGAIVNCPVISQA
jgi:hypothetical protein